MIEGTVAMLFSQARRRGDIGEVARTNRAVAYQVAIVAIMCSGPTDQLHLAGAKKLYSGKYSLSPACYLFMQLMHRTALGKGGD